MFHRRLRFYVSQEVRDLLLCTKYKQTSFVDGDCLHGSHSSGVSFIVQKKIKLLPFSSHFNQKNELEAFLCSV